MHPPAAHLLEYVLLQAAVAFKHGIGHRTAPSFKIVHKPPCLKSGTGHKLLGLGIGIAELQKHVAPHLTGAGDAQRHVDAMERHPVNLTLPTRLVPERHGVGVGAVVKIIAHVHRRGMTFRHFHRRKHIGQRGCHAVPRQMHSGMIFQIPVDPHGSTDIAVGFDTGATPTLAQFEVILAGGGYHYIYLFGKPGIDTLKQLLDRRITLAGKSHRHRHKHQQHKDCYLFHGSQN